MAIDPFSLGAALIPQGIKLVSGLFQKKKANDINAVDPGYQMNTEVIDNARILGDRYNNFITAGTQDAINNLNTSEATAFGQGVQGATSGGDVLDLATKLSYGTGKRLNDIATQNAIGKDKAMLQYLGAKGQAGQELVNKNAYDRDIYQRKLAEKAALTEASNQNTFGAIDSLSSILGATLGGRNKTNNGSLTEQNRKMLIDDLIGRGFDRNLLTTNLGSTTGVIA